MLQSLGPIPLRDESSCSWLPSEAGWSELSSLQIREILLIVG